MSNRYFTIHGNQDTNKAIFSVKFDAENNEMKFNVLHLPLNDHSLQLVKAKSLQVGKAMLFFNQGLKLNVKVIKNVKGHSRVEKLSAINAHPYENTPLSNFSITKDQHDRVFVTGGISNDSSVRDCSVLIYSERIWYSLPQMNLARHDHSTTVLGHNLVAIGGFSTQFSNQMMQIEMLDIRNLCEEGQWQYLMDLSLGSIHQNRSLAAVCALSESEFIILGGTSIAGKSTYKDAILVNIENRSAKRVIKGMPGFNCITQPEMIAPGKVFAFVEREKSKTDKTKVLSTVLYDSETQNVEFQEISSLKQSNGYDYSEKKVDLEETESQKPAETQDQEKSGLQE